MKRIMVILLVSILVINVSSCTGGDKKEKGSSKEVKKTTVAQTKETKKQEESTTTTTTKKENPYGVEFRDYPYKVAGRKIYMEVPNYREMELAYTRIFIVNGVKYVAVTANKRSEHKGITDLKKAHELAYEKFVQNVEASSYINSINIENEKTETINGIEMYRYEGTVNCGTEEGYEYDAYVVGYSFIMDETPCTITGSVIDKEQKEEMINEIRNYVDAMAQTVRSEE